MAVYSLYVISKSGSLLYHYHVDLSTNPIKRQTANDLLVIAGNLHGIHAIAAQITPKIKGNESPTGGRQHCNRSGLRSVECQDFNVYIDQTASGLKLVLFTSKEVDEAGANEIHDLLYELYCDYVMKNPFYTLEMPIRIPSFEASVVSLINECNDPQLASH